MRSGGTRGPRRPAGVGDWIVAEAVDLAAQASNIPSGEITSPVRERARAAFARQVAMYVAHCTGRVPMTELAAIFGRDHSTVAHAVAAVEERRDDRLFGAQLELIEAELESRLDAIVERCRREAQKVRARSGVSGGGANGGGGKSGGGLGGVLRRF